MAEVRSFQLIDVTTTAGLAELTVDARDKVDPPSRPASEYWWTPRLFLVTISPPTRSKIIPRSAGLFLGTKVGVVVDGVVRPVSVSRCCCCRRLLVQLSVVLCCCF